MKIMFAASAILTFVVLCHCSDDATPSAPAPVDGGPPATSDASEDLPDAAAPKGVPDGGKRVFVTSERFDGNLDGLDGADTRCATAAQAASLSGKWSAWLAVSGRNAVEQLPEAGTWYLVDGTEVTDRARIADQASAQSFDVAIHLDERGADVEANVWTGAKLGGVPLAENCDNWTGNADLTGGAGSTKSVDLKWTNSGTPSCAEKNRIYCFER